MSNLKEIYDLPNYRTIHVRFIAPTNYRCSRLCIEEKKRYNEHKPDRKYFDIDERLGSVQKQAFKILQNAGFKIMARSENVKTYTFMVDNWGDDYIKISDL
jgi:hypothetical protein